MGDLNDLANLYQNCHISNMVVENQFPSKIAQEEEEQQKDNPPTMTVAGMICKLLGINRTDRTALGASESARILMSKSCVCRPGSQIGGRDLRSDMPFKPQSWVREQRGGHSRNRQGRPGCRGRPAGLVAGDPALVRSLQRLSLS